MIRIGQLHLERWGHFEGHRLTFGPAGRLHLVHGHNEAGKSTTRRAVSALLFGVPERTTDTYGRPGSDLRIGARLVLDGTSIEVVRRKGRKNTLLDAEGDVLDPAPLEQALGGLAADVYGGLFEITHDSLVEGGQELLLGRGAVGEALFAAAAGTSRLQALLHQLDAEAEELFSARPSKRPLNVRIARHGEALRTLRDASLRPPEHEALTRELAALEAAHARAGTALEEAERERARLERLRGALPLAALRATRAKELEELAGVPVLPADAAARRATAQEQREREQARAAAAARGIARAHGRLDELAVDEALLPFAEQLEEQRGTAAAVAQDTARREDLVAQRTALAARHDAALAALAPALGERAASELAVDPEARTHLEACLQARAGVEEAVGAAREALGEAQRAAERAERERDAAPAAADDAALAATVRAARSAGDVDERLARAWAEERRARSLAEEAAAQLVPACESADALARVPVPAPATVRELLEQVVEAQRASDELRAEAEAIDDRAALARRQRERLAGADAPALDDAALAEAREARDAAWAAVRAALITPVEAGEATTRAEAHEAAVASVDAIADTRLQRAEDVARLADLERELAELERQAEAVAHRRERQEAVLARSAEAWSAAWAPAGSAAPAPAQAGAWLAGRDVVLGHLAAAGEAGERADAAAAQRAEHARALRAALPADGEAEADGRDAAADELPLATLIELAEARLEAVRGDAERAARAAEAVARATAELDDAAAALARAEERQATWQAQWSELRGGCGLAETLAPADALGALRRLEEAAQQQERLGALSREVEAIDARRTAFESAVAELVTVVAPDLGDQPATTAVTILHRRAADARAAAAERDAVSAELEQLEAERAEALAAAQAAEQELAELRAAAGAQDDAALARVEHDCGRAEELRTEIAELDGKLALAGGAPADEVAAAVAQLDADTAPARAEELAQLAAQRREEREQAAEALTRARDELERLERSDEAARAAQEAANLEAEVRELAERYARARLAQRILRDAIARYRSAHEGPLLSRANVLFPALTCERFARLETDVDERDRDVLVAITAGGARRRVEELSDGTREQLFLALRLAAIERHVATATALPVVFDDVLLESDDARAERILLALADLAQQTQVIVLTHHRHLVDIAQSALPKKRLDVIELSGAAAAGDDDGESGDTDTVEEPLPPLHEELAALAAAGEPAPGEQSSLL